MPRRLASAAKASVVRNFKRAVKRIGRIPYRLHRAWLVTRKWSLEYGKAAWYGSIRLVKVSRKKLWLARRWVRRKGRLMWRLITLRKIDRFGRTRTMKRASDLDVASLDDKPFEIEKLDRRRQISDMRSRINRMAQHRRPVVVGPWLSEIGFELLYWIPFVQWAKAYGELRDRDLWVVSRGGVRSWYRQVTDQYVEIFDHFSPQEFRERNLERQREQGGIKHRAVSAFDREILARVEEDLGLDDYELLHPSLMYGFFQPFFQKVASFRLIEAFCYYSRIRPRRSEPLPGLPDDYVAVKFYANDALPAEAENRRFLAQLLAALTRRGHVVSLDTGTRYDDHAAFGELAPERLHTIDSLVSPPDNLEVQTRIIEGARTLYCTYGGFSYLAPLCGTRTVTFYSDRDGFRLEHLELARRVFSALDCPPFLALDVTELPFFMDLAVLDRRPA